MFYDKIFGKVILGWCRGCILFVRMAHTSPRRVVSELEPASSNLCALFDLVTSMRPISPPLTLFDSHPSTPKFLSFHPRCHTIDPFPFSSHHAAHVARCPSQVGHRSRLHLCWEGLLMHIGLINPSFRTFPLSPFALDLPPSIPEFLLSPWPFYYFGHHTVHTSFALLVYAPPSRT